MYGLGAILDRRGDAWRSAAPVAVALVNRNHSTINRERRMDTTFFSRFPPLGLLNIAACIRADAALIRREVDIRVFEEEDYATFEEFHQALCDWLDAAPGPTLVGATTYTHAVEDMEHLLGMVDHARHLVVVGGAHVTVQPYFDNAHIVVRGEGRAPIRHILNHFAHETFGEAEDATGIFWAEAASPKAGRPQYDDSLTSLPSPCYEYGLVEDRREEFRTHITRAVCERPQIYVSTQSCRARCTFCSTYLIHGKSKSRGVSLVEQDLRYLIDQHGHDGFEFWDDDLLQHEQLDELLDMLSRLGKKWYCFGRTETIDERQAFALAEAGCRKIFLGIESMRQERLDYFNKRTTVAQNKRAVEALDAAGIGVIAAFILGAPDDTTESIVEDYHRYLEMPLEVISMSILTPDPGTKEFARARLRGGRFLEVLGGDNGRMLRPDIEKFGVAVPAGLPTVCESISKNELNVIWRVLETHFLLRESIWDKLSSRVPAGLRGTMSKYFYSQYARARLPLPEGTHPSVRELRRETMSRPSVKTYARA